MNTVESRPSLIGGREVVQFLGVTALSIGVGAYASTYGLSFGECLYLTGCGIGVNLGTLGTAITETRDNIARRLGHSIDEEVSRAYRSLGSIFTYGSVLSAGVLLFTRDPAISTTTGFVAAGILEGLRVGRRV